MVGGGAYDFNKPKYSFDYNDSDYSGLSNSRSNRVQQSTPPPARAKPKVESNKHNRAAIAFVDFLVHYGHESTIFPVAHGINADDPEVIQIRFERLYPIKNSDLRYCLEGLSENTSEYDDPSDKFKQKLYDKLQKNNMHKVNNI